MSDVIEDDAEEVEVGGIPAEALRNMVDRIERLNEEIALVQGDVRDIYTEAKSRGFDVRALRRVVRMRKLDPREIEEQDDAYDIYMRALGMKRR